jgi:hypothetical protein
VLWLVRLWSWFNSLEKDIVLLKFKDAANRNSIK